MFLCKFDYRNKNKMDLQQREYSFCFIHSYLLVVKVGQMFSIIQQKCQAIREASARNLWGKGPPVYEVWGPRFRWQLRGSVVPNLLFFPLNLQLTDKVSQSLFTVMARVRFTHWNTWKRMQLDKYQQVKKKINWESLSCKRQSTKCFSIASSTLALTLTRT